MLDTLPNLDDHRFEDGCRTMDVGSWLRSLGLKQYEALFREKDIDAEVLGDLTDADLEKLGVTLGHRKRLLRAIAGLGATEPAAKPTIPAPLPLSTDAAERRPITVMFCDLVGSTSLASKLGAEEPSCSSHHARPSCARSDRLPSLVPCGFRRLWCK